LQRTTHPEGCEIEELLRRPERNYVPRRRNHDVDEQQQTAGEVYESAFGHCGTIQRKPSEWFTL
jgi:hypothetical protein